METTISGFGGLRAANIQHKPSSCHLTFHVLPGRTGLAIQGPATHVPQSSHVLMFMERRVYDLAHQSLQVYRVSYVRQLTAAPMRAARPTNSDLRHPKP